MLKNNAIIWRAEVRDYEVDYQGIVNNANYFHYFDHARAVCLEKMFNLNIKKCAENNVNIVLIKTEVVFKVPLTYGQSFYVSSKFERISRFKFRCQQEIYIDPDDTLSAVSDSVIATITKGGKPYLIENLYAITPLP